MIYHQTKEKPNIRIRKLMDIF